MSWTWSSSLNFFSLPFLRSSCATERKICCSCCCCWLCSFMNGVNPTHKRSSSHSRAHESKREAHSKGKSKRISKICFMLLLLMLFDSLVHREAFWPVEPLHAQWLGERGGRNPWVGVEEKGEEEMWNDWRRRKHEKKAKFQSSKVFVHFIWEFVSIAFSVISLEFRLYRSIDSSRRRWARREYAEKNLEFESHAIAAFNMFMFIWRISGSL